MYIIKDNRRHKYRKCGKLYHAVQHSVQDIITLFGAYVLSGGPLKKRLKN